MRRIRNFVVVGLAVLALGLGATVAHASTVSLTLAQTDAWTGLDCSPCTAGDSGTSVTPSDAFPPIVNDFTRFSTRFDLGASTLGSATVGNLTDLDLDWSGMGFTTFSLIVDNVNESTWTFQLFVKDGDGTTLMSTAFDLDQNMSTVLSIGIVSASFDLMDVDNIWLQVSCGLPCDGSSDRDAEYKVSPVPLPPSLAMFGSALIGLVAFGFARGRQRLTTLKKTG